MWALIYGFSSSCVCTSLASCLCRTYHHSIFRYPALHLFLRIFSRLSHLFKHLACYYQCIASRWNPAVDHSMPAGFGDLFFAKAVVHSCPYVNAKFWASAQGDQHSEVQQRPLSKLKARSCVGAEADFVNVIHAGFGEDIVLLHDDVSQEPELLVMTLSFETDFVILFEVFWGKRYARLL